MSASLAHLSYEPSHLSEQNRTYLSSLSHPTQAVEIGSPILPNELFDRIIDHLHDSRTILSVCSLVCRSWLPSCRLHLFDENDLIRAARENLAPLVALLIARPNIDVNHRDTAEQTPLFWAARVGAEDVVRLLLSRDDIDPNLPDAHGGTPICSAAEGGHTSIVSLLLAREDINPDSKDLNGETPLIWATAMEKEGPLRLLLARDDVDPRWISNGGWTPLKIAKAYFPPAVPLIQTRLDENAERPSGRCVRFKSTTILTITN